MRAKGFDLVWRLALAGALWAGAARAAPDAARQAELLNLLGQDCGACHGLTRKGGLGPSLLPEALAGKSDETLLVTILDGRPGTPMGPWRAMLTEEEARWLVEQLRKGPAR
jgi:cytochrome c55X